jgi:hypothetical protein
VDVRTRLRVLLSGTDAPKSQSAPAETESSTGSAKGQKTMKRDEVIYPLIPDHMRQAAIAWVKDGVPPGSFLTAVLSNNFVEAFMHADGTNLKHMVEWAEWLYNEIPSQCWGSRDRMDFWIRKKAFEREEMAKEKEKQ